MSLISNREAIGLSVDELVNRLTSIYNTGLSTELIARVESKQAKLSEHDVKILTEFFNTTSEDLLG
ncbi:MULTISPECIES: hypothetical protein [Staphylococcus]|jgi:hypothetical protein|uniref:XRE family transcriptional regulator n=1 Tax=Staphylococcus nepalensis TaxID=214473 RepID=A0A291JKH2_9STAP|nr:MULTISPECIES: hypothetical protein [Staphylococcus]VDG67352.1 Uncharacterised protein [Lacrimispora indolis]ATH60364.1 hypothetical protein BJD96_08640 [Staphylococcus nepalensis]ATH65414.1 hypothetical protein BJG89_08750 [Staphylococcus nepalensis]AWI44782.1 hypothetical protein BJG88_08540 [Staphylococcus nepalensis]MBO1204705.1 hypothetical protein [Staphylococcus nepalensis]